jgi:uncharacterized protein (DUF433 family)
MTDQKPAYLERIVRDPNILGGKPTIKGTRVPVSLILNLIAHGVTFSEITEDYPYVTEDDIKAALLYAEARIKGDEADDQSSDDEATHIHSS